MAAPTSRRACAIHAAVARLAERLLDRFDRSPGHDFQIAPRIVHDSTDPHDPRTANEVCLFVSFELGDKEWKIAWATSLGARPRLQTHVFSRLTPRISRSPDGQHICACTFGDLAGGSTACVC